MNRLVLSAPRTIFHQPRSCIARPIISRTYISYKPSWKDNTPVAPHQWGTKIARWFTRLPEMGWLMVAFAIFGLMLWNKLWVTNYYPEYTFLYEDPYVDNPMIPNMKCTKYGQLEKVEASFYGNKNLYHHVYRPEDGVQEGKPWTDPRADLYLKRFFSIGNQKMFTENKVDRYMIATSGDNKGKLELGVGPFSYGKPGDNPNTSLTPPSY